MDVFTARCRDGRPGLGTARYSAVASSQFALKPPASTTRRSLGSVLPARSPLYGWPGFGPEPRQVGTILEMPITLHPWLRVPLAAGVYFRVLPFLLVRGGVRAWGRIGCTATERRPRPRVSLSAWWSSAKRHALLSAPRNRQHRHDSSPSSTARNAC